MLASPTHLTFGKIAELWAAENAGRPLAQNPDQILARFEDGLRKTEFAHAALRIERAPKYVLDQESGDYVRHPARIEPVGNERLQDVLHLRWADARRAWVEGMIISKDDFGQWYAKQGIVQPAFWISVGDDKKDEPAAKTARKLGGLKQSTIDGWQGDQDAIRLAMDAMKTTNIKKAADFARDVDGRSADALIKGRRNHLNYLAAKRRNGEN